MMIVLVLIFWGIFIISVLVDLPSSSMGFPGGSRMVKNLPTVWETQFRFLGQQDPLEKGMTTHSSFLAWRIPWTKEPGGLQSVGLQKVGHDWATNTHTHRDTYQQTLRALFSPRSCQQLLLFLIFLVIAILTDVRWYFIVVFICISLMIALISHASNAQNSPSQASAIHELWTSRCSSWF